MKKLITIVCLCLIAGHIIPEFGEIIERIDQKLADTYINPFLDSDYVFPVYEGQPAGIKLKWFINYWGTDFLFIVVFGLLAHVSYQVSYKLFLICGIYFLYHLFDHFMLWYNYRTSHWLYWVVHSVNAAAALMLIFKKEKKQAIVKSIN